MVTWQQVPNRNAMQCSFESNDVSVLITLWKQASGSFNLYQANIDLTFGHTSPSSFLIQGEDEPLSLSIQNYSVKVSMGKETEGFAQAIKTCNKDVGLMLIGLSNYLIFPRVGDAISTMKYRDLWTDGVNGLQYNHWGNPSMSVIVNSMSGGATISFHDLTVGGGYPVMNKYSKSNHFFMKFGRNVIRGATVWENATAFMPQLRNAYFQFQSQVNTLSNFATELKNS